MRDAHPGRHQGTGEGAEGLRHHCELAACRHGVCHGIRMIAGGRLLVVERKGRPDGIVAESIQRLDGRAVHARIGSRARNQDEGWHLAVEWVTILAPGVFTGWTTCLPTSRPHESDGPTG